jgi:hypothetical protein
MSQRPALRALEVLRALPVRVIPALLERSSRDSAWAVFLAWLVRRVDRLALRALSWEAASPRDFPAPEARGSFLVAEPVARLAQLLWAIDQTQSA